MKNNKITIGKTYRMSGAEVICVGFTKKGYAKMQTLGMTSGYWPGEGNVSNYNDVTRRFTEEWAGIIKKFKLPTLKRAKKNEGIRTALAKAAENYSSFGASHNYTWLGTSNFSNSAWFVFSNGNYNYYDRSSDFVIAPTFILDTAKVILDGDEIKKASNDDIELGKTYKMSRIEAICVGFTKKGYAKMQTLGMTSGYWPGEDDISEYDDVTYKFTSEWSDVITKFRLPTRKQAKKNKLIKDALKEVARDYSSFGASNSYAWLGTVYGSSGAWYVGSGGSVHSNGNQNHSYVVAPAFNLDESKIILDGGKIKKIEDDPKLEADLLAGCDSETKDYLRSNQCIHDDIDL